MDDDRVKAACVAWGGERVQIVAGGVLVGGVFRHVARLRLQTLEHLCRLRGPLTTRDLEEPLLKLMIDVHERMEVERRLKAAAVWN